MIIAEQESFEFPVRCIVMSLSFIEVYFLYDSSNISPPGGQILNRLVSAFLALNLSGF